jgi:O-antigen biosynthesis protein
MASVPVTMVTNTTNLGFPAAVNQGLRLARGEYLVRLNNDVVVTDAWLDQLIGLVNAKTSVGIVPGSAESTPPWPLLHEGGNGCLDQASSSLSARVLPIGLVGPVSNFVAPPQLVENAPYRDVNEMHRFAKWWRDEHRKQWFTVPRLSGFCLRLFARSAGTAAEPDEHRVRDAQLRQRRLALAGSGAARDALPALTRSVSEETSCGPSLALRVSVGAERGR